MADGLLNKASIILTPTGYKAGTLYNVAPVVEPYEDFDFARASVASRVNSSGLVEMVGRTLGSELVTNGDFATDSNWFKDANWSIASGKATSNGFGRMFQSISFLESNVGTTVEVTFEIVEVTNGGVVVNCYGGISQQFSTVGLHTFVTTTTNTLNLYFNNAGAGGGFVGSIDNVSVKEVIDTNNIPRISYDSNGDNGHILLEPTSTNLVTYSEDLKDGYSTNNSSVYLNDAVSPDGTTTANKFNSTATGSSISKAHANSSALFHTVSIFLKKGTIDIVTLSVTGGSPAISASTTVNLTSGTITASSGNGSITPTITNYGNDWYRITASSTSNGNVANPTISIVNSSTTASGYFYMWGLQFEGLSYATSYIPTLTGSTETRATETATGAGSAELINSTEGVLYAEIAALRQVNDNIQFLAINSSSYTQNSIYIQLRSSTNQIGVWAYSNGSNEVAEPITLTDITAFNKIAIRWKVNDFNIFINGASVFTDTSYNAPTSNSLNSLEFARGGSSNIYCKCKALAVFNEALSDAELNNLTG